VNQDNADPAMASSARVERRSWWFTVSNAADKSRSTDEGDEPLGRVTASRAVSVECVVLKPDW